MAVASTADLVLACLARGLRVEALDARPSATAREVSRALSGPQPRLGRLLELVAALERLEAEGYVRPRNGDGGPETRFVLTERGVDRAVEVRERLAAEPVTVDGGEDRPLATVAERFGRSLVAAAAEVTDDGVYHPHRTVEASFVGRGAELDALRDHLADVREGAGRAVMVTGPPGVGKTELADRFLDRAEGVDVLRARARAEGAVAYQPLRDAVAGLDGDPFGDAGPAAPAVVEDRRAALFGELTALLAPPPGDPPRVLYLDDLHLAGPGTFAYLEYLLDRVEGRRLLVLGSYRPAELADDAPVEPGRGVHATVELEPFGREGTRALVEGVAGTRRVPDEFVAAVHERTGGTPLFVEATVEALLEAGRVDPALDVFPEDPDAVDVPGEVRTVIDDYVDRFPAPAEAVLEWAALLGERFDAGVLVAVADHPEDRCRRYLDSLVESGVFDRDGDELAFRSEVVREALLRGIGEDERRARHGRIAVVLEDRPGADAAAVAHHHERAGNRERAIAAHERAVEAAIDVYAHRRAVDHYRSALALARDGEDDGRVADLAARLAGVYATLGEYDEAARFARFARERAGGDGHRLATLHLAEVATATGDYDRTIELADAGLGLGDDELACRLLATRAEAEYESGRIEDCLDTARRLRDLAADVGADGPRAAAHRWTSMIHFRRGDNETAREHVEAAVDARGDDRRGVAENRRELGYLALAAGESEAAVEQFEAVLAAFEAVGDRHAVAETHHGMGSAHWAAGQYDRAREHFETALAGFRNLGDRHSVGQLQVELGAALHSTGDVDAAREYTEAAIDTLREVGDDRGVGIAHINLASGFQNAGEYDRAREEYETAASILEGTDDRQHFVHASLGAAGSTARVGPYGEVLAHADRARSTLAEFEDLASVAGTLSRFEEDIRTVVERAVEAGDRPTVREWCELALDATAEADETGIDREWFRRRLDDLETEEGSDGVRPE
ncbi:hypothetical protein BRD00_08410 [Halobacteriales archaeon QS_8_69_26]|nr:MAG: hypothetical protein BRD00_08410 [Halobacteriales archaeon QS_8_69_26]